LINLFLKIWIKRRLNLCDIGRFLKRDSILMNWGKVKKLLERRNWILAFAESGNLSVA
jgi:hypothetical protein